jgi:hypothetical protein
MEVRKFTRRYVCGKSSGTASVTGWLGRAEHNFRMEERAGNPSGDSDQVSLTNEDFDLRGAREVRQVDGAPGPDARGSGIVDGDGGELRQEFAGVDEKIRESCWRLLRLTAGPGEILCCVGLPCSLCYWES